MLLSSVLCEDSKESASFSMSVNEQKLLVFIFGSLGIAMSLKWGRLPMRRVQTLTMEQLLAFHNFIGHVAFCMLGWNNHTDMINHTVYIGVL